MWSSGNFWRTQLPVVEYSKYIMGWICWVNGVSERWVKYYTFTCIMEKWWKMHAINTKIIRFWSILLYFWRWSVVIVHWTGKIYMFKLFRYIYRGVYISWRHPFFCPNKENSCVFAVSQVLLCLWVRSPPAGWVRYCWPDPLLCAAGAARWLSVSVWVCEHPLSRWVSWKGVGEVGRGADGPRREVRGGERRCQVLRKEGGWRKKDHFFWTLWWTLWKN